MPVLGAAAAVLLTPPAPPHPEGDRRATDGRTAQAPGRGERPVYQARISSYGHAEGDTLTYEVSDTPKDELLLSNTVLIEEVRVDGQMQANGGRLQFTRTMWYAPKLGMPVVIEIEDNDEAGKPLRRERIEPTLAQQARTAN